jgi:hypothetical protein
MIRQAHTYLVGAMGGATLIAIAIAVFVMLVSAQVFRDWPIAALGDGGGESAEVSNPQPASAGAAASADTADARSGAAAAGAAGASGDRRVKADLRSNGGSTAAGGGLVTTGGDRDPTEPGSTGDPGGAGGGAGGGAPTSTASNQPGGGPSSPGTGAGADGGGSTSSPSGQVTETVNDTVNQVDEAALDGTLGDSGVTKVTEGVVNGVAGPESTVGKVVDGAADTVGGILGKP